MGRGDFFVLDAEVGIIFLLLLLLSLVKSKWRMNSDLRERNREASSSFSESQDRLSLFLFLSPCLHRLSLDFITFLYFYSCVLFNFNWLFIYFFFVIYNDRILNGGVALPANIIYHFLTYMWQNFKWTFFLTWQHLGKGFCIYI